MTDITWPVAVPHQSLAGGWSIPQLHEPNLSTPMAGGNTRQRRRVTVDISKMQMQINLTDAQLQSFLTFYKTTLANGVLRFNMLVWAGGAYVSKICMFEPAQPPKMSKAGFAHTRVDFTLLVEAYY